MAATQSKHPVLPKLKKQRQTAGFDERGIWSARQAIALDQLSEDLDIVKVGIDINSIPDMWARPLLFEMALFQNEHLLRPRVVGEWRGLLAMLALKEVSDISNLTVTPINLPASEESAVTKSTTTDADFLKTLARLAPTGSVSSDTSWRELYVILNDDAAIGMMSPTTLVATATHYFGRIDSSQVPWFNGKLLLDPTGKTHEARSFLSEHARESLAWWLNELQKELGNQSVAKGGPFDANSQKGNALIIRIGEYIKDVGGSKRTYGRGAGYSVTSGIFTLLDKPVKRTGGDPRDSHFVLASSRRDDWTKRNSLDANKSDTEKEALPLKAFREFPAILIVDEEVARQWKRNSTDLVVWGSTSLRNALPYGGFDEDPPEHKKEMIGIDGAKAQIWSPQWLFKKQLHVVRKSDAFPSTVGINMTPANQELTYGNEVVTPILPLDRVLIDQLTVNDLAERISFEQKPDGILVRLTLELSGPNTNGAVVEFTKLYAANKDQIRVIEDVPLLAIWPDFRASQWGWKAYYTYHDTAEVKETFTAKPYVPGLSSVDEKSLTSGSSKTTRRITRTDSYPEAMICFVKDDKSEIGYLLVQQPDELPKMTLPYKVGVDFGATGTSVYFKSGHENPAPFHFRDRYVFVSSIGEERRATIYDIALPSQRERTPFLSIFRTFPNAPAQELRPLMDGIIHFPSGNSPQALEADQSITFNLKWSGRKEDSYKVEAFLEQICLQVAAEAAVAGASEIEWWFSYPTAFSITRQNSFQSIWQKSTEWCAKLTGVDSSSPSCRTESVATALYFRDPNGFNAPTTTGAVCIDIGGSTSDIAVWQDESLCWQTSIRFAGRNIFLDYLLANPEFLGQLRGESHDEKSSGASPRSNLSFYVAADVLLRDEGEKLFASLPYFAEQPQMAKLERFLAVGLAGIFYYVGLLVNYLRDRGIYSLEIPKFYIGGNGSRIFRWLNMGRPFDSKAAINEVFKTVFLRASGLAQSPLTIKISNAPKAEAAFGLICGTELKESSAHHDVLAGETFLRKSQEKPWNKLINANSFQDLSAPKTLDRISDFVLAFDQAARQAQIKEIAPGNAARDDLLREVRICLANAIEDAKKPGHDGIEVEPIFILALKCLLRQINEETK